jgi:hypothetical protein
MRQRLARLRPTPAMAIALVALFCSLGGVSYGLATGSISSREIRNNTILSRDVRNGAIQGRDVKGNSLTGSDVAESRLGTVPNADRVDGHNLGRIDAKLPASTPTRPVLAFGGLILNATCKANGDLDLTATTAANNAIVHIAAIGSGNTVTYAQDNDLDIGQSVNAVPDNQDNNVDITLTYAAPGTSIVTAKYLAQHTPGALASGNTCFVLGSATQSG